MHHNYSPGEQLSLTEWIRGNAKLAKECLKQFYRYNGGAALRVMQNKLEQIPFGTSPLAYDWDACIVLDCCRPDAFELVAPEYDWLPNTVNRVNSPASHSRGWYKKALNPEKYGNVMAKTALVSWNPHTHIEHSNEDWAVFDEVWRTGWDDTEGLVPPGIITDHAIRAAREHNTSRLLVHYQQPHDPFPGIESERMQYETIGDARTPGPGRHTVWERCIDSNDDLSISDVWDAMLSNLRWALDSVEILLNNLDADRVLLTADHGECFGELGMYSHYQGCPVPWLVRVPFVWVTGTDTNQRNPERDAELIAGDSGSCGTVESRLRALGYK